MRILPLFFYSKNNPAASAAEVASANVVGYQKIDIANGYTMIGTSFQSVGMDNSISIQDIKTSGLTGLDWTFATLDGDTLMIWDASSQMYTTELNYTGDVVTPEMAEMGIEAGKWFDMNTFANAEMTLENGDAFWILSSATGAKVTIAGEVPTAANSVNIVPGYNMIANPYPKAVKVNDLFTVTGLTGLDWTFATLDGDMLMIWDPSTQMYVTELNYTGDEVTPEMAEMGIEAGKWFDMNTFANAETEIPVGGAFWIKSSGNGTLTFK